MAYLQLCASALLPVLQDTVEKAVHPARGSVYTGDPGRVRHPEATCRSASAYFFSFVWWYHAPACVLFNVTYGMLFVTQPKCKDFATMLDRTATSFRLERVPSPAVSTPACLLCALRWYDVGFHQQSLV